MKFEECNVNCSENINHNHGQKYLRQTLDFIWNSPLGKKFDFYFSRAFY